MDLASPPDAQRSCRAASIIVPAMNYPAFRAGRPAPRRSTRATSTGCSPAGPDGTVTEKIADYFQRTLLPLADVVLDIHSGGKTLDFLPFAALAPAAGQEAGGGAAWPPCRRSTRPTP